MLPLLPILNSTLQFHNKKIILAPRWKRLVAALLDLTIQAVFVIPFIFYIYGFAELPDPGETSRADTLKIACFGILVYSLVNGKLLLENGQTVGKMLLKIRITQFDGRLPIFRKNLLPHYIFFFGIRFTPFVAKLIIFANLLFILGKIDDACTTI